MKPNFLIKEYFPINVVYISYRIFGYSVVQSHKFVQWDKALSFRLVSELIWVLYAWINSPETEMQRWRINLVEGNSLLKRRQLINFV